ncbi:MmyB family transcriptional regulator [Streptomyces triculaminicus]|uniref:MmyB family transcriptional regulator n=1 Tax=Streptomyces triculaminicus TaxID=2816232 RepID=UPI0037A7E887
MAGLAFGVRVPAPGRPQRTPGPSRTPAHIGGFSCTPCPRLSRSRRPARPAPRRNPDDEDQRGSRGHDALEYTHGTKRYHHPLVDEPALDYESPTLPDDPDQALYLYTAEPDSRSAHALRLLGSLSAPDLTVVDAPACE